MFVISGNSEDIDGQDVADEIIETCLEKLEGRTPKAGILFASIDSEMDVLLERLLEQWPDLELIGASTDGELSSEGFAEDSVTLTLMGGDNVSFTVGIGRQLSQDIEQACQSAIDEALRKTDLEPKLCLAIPESLTANVQKVIDTLGEKLGDDVPLLGATAGDQWRFEKTYQFYGKELLSDSVPILIASGDINYGFGVGFGFSIVGEPGVVTRSEGSVCHEIDGISTLDFYRKYLGPDAGPKGELPLVILNDEGGIEYLRASQEGFVDHETGAVTFFADVPQGSKVQIAVTDRDAIIDGCTESIEQAMQQFPEGKQPEAAIIFSCAGRRLLLGTRVSDEFEMLRNKLGDQISISGFYGYGEICPNTQQASARFHNETFITLLLGA